MRGIKEIHIFRLLRQSINSEGALCAPFLFRFSLGAVLLSSRTDGVCSHKGRCAARGEGKGGRNKGAQRTTVKVKSSKTARISVAVRIVSSAEWESQFGWTLERAWTMCRTFDQYVFRYTHGRRLAPSEDLTMHSSCNAGVLVYAGRRTSSLCRSRPWRRRSNL